MKLGVREFRERFSAVADGTEPAIATKNGCVVERCFPERRKAAETMDMTAWATELEKSRDDRRSRTPDWRERVAADGLDPDCNPIPR